MIQLSQRSHALLNGIRLASVLTLPPQLQQRSRMTGWRLGHPTPLARWSTHGESSRRTSISDLLDLTGDLALVSELAGHANPQTTKRYALTATRIKRCTRSSPSTGWPPR